MHIKGVCKFLSKGQLQKALMARKKNGKSLRYNLGALNFVDEAELTHFLAQQYNGCRIAQPSKIHHIPENVLKAIPAKFIKRYLILPFRSDSGNLYTATMNPNNLDVFNDIRFISGYSVLPYLASEYHLLSLMPLKNFIASKSLYRKVIRSWRTFKGRMLLNFARKKKKKKSLLQKS